MIKKFKLIAVKTFRKLGSYIAKKNKKRVSFAHNLSLHPSGLEEIPPRIEEEKRDE
jgi:hypothetical protein